MIETKALAPSARLVISIPPVVNEPLGLWGTGQGNPGIPNILAWSPSSYVASDNLDCVHLSTSGYNQFTAQISYSNPNLFFAGVQFRTASQQFDDDQNLLPLKRYALTDASISRRLVRYLDAFFSVQNLFNSQYSVARTPIESLGMPRMFRGGLRIRFEP